MKVAGVERAYAHPVAWPRKGLVGQVPQLPTSAQDERGSFRRIELIEFPARAIGSGYVALGFQFRKFAHGQLPFLRLEQLPVHDGHASNIYLHSTLVQRY